MRAGPLLANHCRIVTRDVDEGQSCVSEQWERYRYRDLRGPYGLRWHQANLGRLSLSYVATTHAITVECPLKADWFRVMMPEAGRIRQYADGVEAVATSRNVVGHARGHDLRLDVERARMLFLSLDGGFVRSAWRRRFGQPAIPAGIGLLSEAPVAAGLRSLSRWMATEADRPDSELLRSPRFAAKLEQAALELLLACFEDRFPPPRRSESVSEARMRKVEEWMEARLGEALAIDDCAAVAGVSVRTLEAAFRRFRACTPRQYFIRRRLERVRLELENPVIQTSVTDVATQYGFFELGRFAARYRQAFGEAPSATLARGRRRRS